MVEDEVTRGDSKVAQAATFADQREIHQLKRQLDLRFGLDNIVGHDYKMLKIFDLVEAVADSRTTVLMTGGIRHGQIADRAGYSSSVAAKGQAVY